MAGPGLAEVTDAALLRELELGNEGGSPITAPQAGEAALKGLTHLLSLPRSIYETARAGDLAARSWIADKTGMNIGPGSEYDRFAQGIQSGPQKLMPSGDEYRDMFKEWGLLGGPDAQPQTGTQKEQAAAIEGGVAGLVAGPYGVIPGAIGATFDEKARAAGQEPSIGRSILTTVAPGALQKGAGKAAGATFGTAPKGSMLRAMSEEGITPRLVGEATQNKNWSMLQNMLSRTFGSAETMRRATDQTLQELDVAVNSAAKGIAPLQGAKAAGEGIRFGIDEWKSRKFQPGYVATLNKIPIAPDDRISLRNMFDSWSRIKSEFGRGPNADVNLQQRFSSSTVDGIVEDAMKDVAAGNGVRWESVKAMRTRIGAMASDTHLYGTTEKGQLDQLYRALSEDMRDAAAARGPAALKAFEVSNQYYTAGRKVADETLDRLYTARIPELVYQRATEGNATDIWRLRSTLKGSEWNSVPATVLNQMGRKAEGSAFDPALFLRNWQGMDEGAKRALFSGGRYTEARGHIDNIVKMTEAFKTAASTANFSNTAGTMYLLSAIGAFGTGLATGETDTSLVALGTHTVGNWAAAKLLTSPAFVRFIATPARLGDVPARMHALSAVVRREPDIEPAVREYIAALEANHPTQAPDASEPPPAKR